MGTNFTVIATNFAVDNNCRSRVKLAIPDHKTKREICGSGSMTYTTTIPGEAVLLWHKVDESHWNKTGGYDFDAVIP